MAARSSHKAVSVPSSAEAKRFPSQWDVDFGPCGFFVHELSIEGRWAFREEEDEDDEPSSPALIARLESYLKSDDFAGFLALTVEGGSWTSIARLTAAMGKPSVSVERLASKKVPSWKVKAILPIAIADETFDGSAWVQAVPEMLSHYEMSSEYMSGGESLQLVLVPRSVRAKTRDLKVYLPTRMKASFRVLSDDQGSASK